MKAGRAALLAALIAVSAGCASPSTGAAAPEPTAASTASSPGAGSLEAPPGSPRLDTDDAIPAVAGRHYDLTSDLSTVTAQGDAVAVLALTPQGQVLAALSEQAPQGKPRTSLPQSSTGLLDATAFTPFPVRRDAGQPKKQAVYGDASSRYSAWTETSSNSLDVFDWTVFIHDHNSGQTRAVGDSSQISNKALPPAPGETVPTIGAKDVFWSTPRPRSDGQGFDLPIMAAPLNGQGEMREVVPGGLFPAADGDRLVYAATNTSDRSMPEGDYEIRQFAEGATRVLAAGRLPAAGGVTGVAAHGGAVAFSIGNSAATTSVMTLIESDGSRTDIAMHHDGFALPIRLNDRVLAWGSASGNGDGGQYLLDRTSRQLYKLGDAPGLSYIHADDSGQNLAWLVLGSSSANPSSLRLVRWLA